MTFDDVNTNHFEAKTTRKDSVPRIGKRPRQPYIGSTVQPPSNDSSKARSTEETDFDHTIPSDFAGHHSTRLLVRKNSIHDECWSARGSIYKHEVRCT